MVDYATLAEFKARLNIAVADTSEDTVLSAVLTAISRQIDDYTGRRFSATTETRYFTPQLPRCLLVDDLLSISAGGLQTDEDGDRTYETTWATTDYDLAPENAALESRPYWEIRTAPLGLLAFPVGLPRAVKIVGSWGYSAAVPAVITEACLHQSGLTWRQKDNQYGTIGGEEFTVETRAYTTAGLHPFVKRMLDPYRRLVVA